MELLDVGVGAFLVVLGLLLGVVFEPLAEHFRKGRRRRSLAIALSSEITLIRIQAEQGIPMHEESLKNVEKMSKDPRSIPNMAINDPDFPTSLHSALLNEIDLFDAGLQSLTSDLYVSVDRTQHLKQQNLRSDMDFISSMASTSGRLLTDFEVNMLRVKGQSSIHYVKTYVKCLYLIKQLADDTLKELGKIAEYNPNRKVADAFSEPLREEFGPFPPTG